MPSGRPQDSLLLESRRPLLLGPFGLEEYFGADNKNTH